MAGFLEKMITLQHKNPRFAEKCAAAVKRISGLSFSVLPEACLKEIGPFQQSAPLGAKSSFDPAGQWISAACWHDCGGRCMNKVLVKDGVVLRQKTDDTHPDSFDFPQQRGCVRGKAQQQQCFGVDRLKYPMKRKNWSPDHPNGHLRGRDEWERISWEEAIQYCADQFISLKEKYGAQTFLTGSWGSSQEATPLLALGGHTSVADSTSYGTYLLRVNETIGMETNGFSSGNDRFDLLQADYCVLLSCNTAWSAPGTPMMNYLRGKEAGVKFITIDPMYSSTAQALDAEWIPVRPGTDTAFLLGVASEMLRLEQEAGNIIDWHFLDRYTVGFDARHRPADLKTDCNFVSYLNGEYDGVPKSAQWASKISGAPVEKISMLARVLGKQNNVWFMYSFASARNNGAENLPQLVLTVGAMGGHMGKPGNCTALSFMQDSGTGGPRLVKRGGKGFATGLSNPVDGVILGPQVWDAVLTGKYHMIGDYYGYAPLVHAGEDRQCDIHCIVNMDEHAYLQTGPNLKAGIEAYRSVDFVMSSVHFLTTPAKYSDIILPVTTRWEMPGGLAETNREFLFCYSQVTQPLYEAKSDQEIYCLLIDAMGMDSGKYYPISEKQQFFNQIKGAVVVKKDNKEISTHFAGSGAVCSSELCYEPLVAITQADIDAWGVEGTPQTGRISMQEFIQNGGYQVERHVGDSYGAIGYQDFIADPVRNPRETASGKFEICSQRKADLFNSFGIISWNYQPYPEYIVPTTGYETTYKFGDLNGEKGEYPFLLYNIHYLRRSHSTFDNCSWLREAWPNPVFISAQDASALHISSGDMVRIITRTAQTVRKASVMEGLIPGVVSLPHGAWLDLDEKTGIDKGGSDSYLIGNEISGSGITPYNNINCRIEKWSAPVDNPDVQTGHNIPLVTRKK